MRTFAAALALVGMLAVGFTLSAAPVPKEKTTAEKLVGRWKLTASSEQGAPDDVTFFVILTAKGEMTIKIEPKEKGLEAIVRKGKYKVLPADKDHPEDRIDYTVEDDNNAMRQEVLKIKKLTDDELVTTDPKDVKEEFKRVKDEKKSD